MEFAYFDGDDIGGPLELLLLEERVSDACNYSKLVSAAMGKLISDLSASRGVDVLFSGGDDLLAAWRQGRVDVGEIEAMRRRFTGLCGRTISVGVGSSASEALGNLRKAKLSGKDRVMATMVVCE
ncbi:mCpol domain-containing protein [Streptomyces sedi]|uniref:MCpol domain-containing protein n=1 Tax=Streptomyces sedi TaxID=555059 RepID=A0A5C4V871_9ACTN|nr:mCpol domain-containing protein [Streptomyces sedi]TNM32094.1 mCpol domain-containing protein [Streptomyces sedi]